MNILVSTQRPRREAERAKAKIIKAVLVHKGYKGHVVMECCAEDKMVDVDVYETIN